MGADAVDVSAGVDGDADACFVADVPTVGCVDAAAGDADNVAVDVPIDGVCVLPTLLMMLVL